MGRLAVNKQAIEWDDMEDWPALICFAGDTVTKLSVGGKWRERLGWGGIDGVTANPLQQRDEELSPWAPLF